MIGQEGCSAFDPPSDTQGKLAIESNILTLHHFLNSGLNHVIQKFQIVLIKFESERKYKIVSLLLKLLTWNICFKNPIWDCPRSDAVSLLQRQFVDKCTECISHQQSLLKRIPAENKPRRGVPGLDSDLWTDLWCSRALLTQRIHAILHSVSL